MTLVKKVPFFRDIRPHLLERVSKPSSDLEQHAFDSVQGGVRVPEKGFRMRVFEYSKTQNQQPMLEM